MRDEVMDWVLLATLLFFAVVAVLMNPGNVVGAPTPFPMPF